VGFTHGLAAAIYQGNLLWNRKHSLSSVSPFMLYEQDQLLSKLNAWYLHLHLLLKKARQIVGGKATQKQEIKVPSTHNKLIQSLCFYGNLTTILHSTERVLMLGVKSTLLAVQCKKLTLKVRIASNQEYATKFPYAM
jgi:hypothetical protein